METHTDDTNRSYDRTRKFVEISRRREWKCLHMNTSDETSIETFRRRDSCLQLNAGRHKRTEITCKPIFKRKYQSYCTEAVIVVTFITGIRYK